MILFIAGIHHTSAWKHQDSLLGHDGSAYGHRKRLRRDAGKKQPVKDDWLTARTEMATFEHTIRSKMIKPGNCNDM